MNIYKLLSSAAIGVSMLITSCSEYTDIQPKGMNLLETSAQLEMLLNDYYQYFMMMNDVRAIGSDIVFTSSSVPYQLSLPYKSANTIYWTYDEVGHDKELPNLVNIDYTYTGAYMIIGKVANPILQLVDKAQGEEDHKRKIKCEALTLRAFAHFLAVQKFAKAYNSSYAAETPSIIYFKETDDIIKNQPQRSLQEVYDDILADCNKAIEIDGLPAEPVNTMRMGKPMLYAVKAWTLAAMHRLSEAADAAREALKYNSTIEDYNTLIGPAVYGMGKGIIRPMLGMKEDYFCSYDFFDMNVLLPECMAAFEPGYLSLTAIPDYDMSHQWDEVGGYCKGNLGIEGKAVCVGTDCWNPVGPKSTHMYLILAEDAIERGQFDEAMGYLDTIREKRFRPADYHPLKGTGINDKATAIAKLKQISHGECAYTFYNFVQRKRWNQLPDYKQNYSHTIDGKTYTITPESTLWIFPFPTSVTSINSLVKQNF